jgi:hypothetical protein
MGTLITLVVAIVILAAASRLLWPRSRRPPLPLYAGTIFAAFFAGMMLGQLAEGRDAGRAFERAGLISPLILLVALISWFKINPDGSTAPAPARADRKSKVAQPRAGGKNKP